MQIGSNQGVPDYYTDLSINSLKYDCNRLFPPVSFNAIMYTFEN